MTIDWSGLPPKFLLRIDGVALYDGQNAMVVSGGDLLFYDLINGKTSSPTMALRDSLWNWPPTWNSISDLVEYDDTTNLIFNGGSYLWFDLGSTTVAAPVVFEGLPAGWGGKVDAALRWDLSQIWFIQGTEYVQWDLIQDTMTDPAKMSDWSGWPVGWDRVDAAFGSDGYAYFFRGGKHLVYDQLNQQFLRLPAADGQ
ncbi:MAG: hypothetical protein IPO90_04165 [Flavobacteriales bacterium]|nr:hypothetical protein [Flavobacteriales bacterium]